MTPEDYWISRGADLIGMDVLRDGFKARQADTYEAIAQQIPSDEIVMDVGCNVGALIHFLEFLGNKGGYFGFDTNPNAIRYLEEQGVSCDIGSIRNLDTESKSYHNVVVKDVLEHLESFQLCAEAFRIATERVILSFFMPPIPAPEIIRQTDQGYYHNRYNEREIIAFANAKGWRFQKRIDTWEHGTTVMNRTYVFRPNQ